jgi:hypothetical protein
LPQASSQIVTKNDQTLEGDGFEASAYHAFRFAIRESIKFFKETLEDFTHHMKPEGLISFLLFVASIIIVSFMRQLITSPILGFFIA